MVRKFIDRFKWHLTQTLAAKTNWGRNELTQAIEGCINQALLDVMD
jgi:hypothetical protein